MIKVNIWVKLLLALPAALVAQRGLVALGGWTMMKLMPAGGINPISTMLPVAATCSALAFVLVATLFTRLLDRQPLSQLGFQLNNALRRTAMGAGVAVFIIGLIALILWASGYASFWYSGLAGVQVASMLFTMIMIAIGEECFCRGYIQRNLQQSLSPLPAIVISAAIFMLMHAGNPSKNLLAMPGIFTGGLLLGINYLYTRNLWFGIALHTTWNFLQGPLLGFVVSGLHLPSVLIQTNTGPDWMTGGSFGPEASVLACVLNIVITLLLSKYFRKRETAPVSTTAVQ